MSAARSLPSPLPPPKPLTDDDLRELRNYYQLRHTVVARAIDELLERRQTPCPYVVTDGEGTSHCRLAADAPTRRDDC